MNKKLIHILLAVSLIVVMASCREEKDRQPVPVKSEASLSIIPGQWLYYSVKEDKIVGTSTIGNETQDKDWFKRTDWDIAFSEGGLRTNSRTSGSGNAGIAILSDSLFENAGLDCLRQLDYVQDTVGIRMPVPLVE